MIAKFSNRSRPSFKSMARCPVFILGIVSAFSLSSLVEAAPASEFPNAPVHWSGGAGQAELHIAGDMAVLTLRRSDGSIVILRSILFTSDALAILADEKLSFAWPALLAWAGNDLETLRDRAALRAKIAWEAGLPAALPTDSAEKYSGGGQLASTLQYARALTDAGHRSEAILMLRQTIARDKADTASDRQFLMTRLASLLFESGDFSESLKLLERMQTDPKISNDYHFNVQINLAFFLARSGDAERALALIDKAWTAFRLSAVESEDSAKVPDSDAEFAGIKACALYRLGRVDQAMRLMSMIEPKHEESLEVPATGRARLRAFACMGDAAALANEYAAQLETAAPGSDLLVEVQPDSYALPSERMIRTTALRQPALTKVIKGRVRFLSGALQPALSKWRDTAAEP